MKRLIIIGLGIVLIFIGATSIIRHAILGGATVKTPATTSVTQQITQSVTSTPATSPTPVFSSDVVVKNIKYFDNKTWLVATIDQKSVPGNIAYIIMQKTGEAYTTVSGPGTDFAGILPKDTPNDVAQYIRSTTGTN